jgi:hypothetical protein
MVGKMVFAEPIPLPLIDELLICEVLIKLPPPKFPE